MANANSKIEIRNSEPFRFPMGLKVFLGGAMSVGAVGFLVALMANPGRAWPAFLVNFFYFLAIAAAGALFTALQHITNAYWSVTVRRIAEAFMSYLPVAFVLAIVLFIGRNHLYEWASLHSGGAHEAAAHDAESHAQALLQLKTPYLNSGFFAIRIFLFLALWMFLGFKMRRNSLLQDVTGEAKYTLSNIRLSCAFIPLFGVSFTLLSFDLLMSLEPHWFSTIFGVYCFSGSLYSGLSLMAILLIYGGKQGVFNQDIVNENHLHDVGKLMFTFVVFWAYIMFSQLMLQWYANLPEEIPYFIRRFHGGWWPFAVALFVAHFVIPFLLLCPRDNKRNPTFLFWMALFMLAAQWFDTYFMVAPVFFPEGPVFGWVEVTTLLAFTGIFGMTVGRFLEKVPAIPLKDPRLAECLAHTQ